MALKAFRLALTTPWMIMEAGLHQILEIATREHVPDFEEVAKQKARRMDNTDIVGIREGGVAVVNIIGPIFRYANFFTEFSGGSTVQTIARDFNEAISNPAVSSIILNIDSPGGEVAGISELSEIIFKSRGKKPIAAYGDGLVASAAYFIASAADEIIIDNTALVGSIGVVASVPNPGATTPKQIEFVSSGSEKKRPDPTTESGKAQIQTLVDHLADVFIETVARNRGVSAETVRAKYGQGDVLVGKHAVKAGLADKLGSFEKLVSQLASGAALGGKSRGAAANNEGEIMASKFEELKARLQSLLKAEGVEPEAEPLPGQEKKAPTVDQSELDRRADVKEKMELQAQLQAEQNNAAMLKRQLEMAEASRMQSEAATFVEAQIRAGKMMPAERESYVLIYVQALRDDKDSPTEKPRIDTIKATVESRVPHKLTEERIGGGEDVKLRPEGSEGADELSEARRRKLLGMTPVGKAALESTK